MGLFVVDQAFGGRRRAGQQVLQAVGKIGLLQHRVAGRLAHIAVDQQYLAVLLRQGQGQIGRNGGFALVFQKAGDHQHIPVGHMLLHPAAELADGFHVAEAGDRIGDQNSGFPAPETGEQGHALLLVGDLAQVIAVQLFPGFSSAADRIPGEGHCRQKRAGGQSADHQEFLHLTGGVGTIDGAFGHRGALQHLQHRAVDDPVGHRFVVVDDGLGNQKRRPGIGGRDSDGKQVGFGNHGGLNGTVKGRLAHLFQNRLAQNGAVEQLREYGSQTGGGGQAAVDRGGAAPAGDHKGGGGLIHRRVRQIRFYVGAHTQHQCGQHHCQPPLCHILDQYNRVEGQKARFGVVIRSFHRLILPPQRSVWYSRYIS